MNTLKYALLIGLPLFSGATLLGEVINRANEDLTGLDLSNRDLTGSNFSNSILSAVNFRNSTQTDVNFAGAILGGDIEKRLLGTAFGSTNLTFEQLQSTGSYKSKSLDLIYISGDVSGWDFSGQSMIGASLWNSTASAETNFTDSWIHGVSWRMTDLQLKGFNAAHLESTASYKSRTLYAINFGHCDLSGADLSGQNLQGSRFYNVNMSNTNLTNADFRGEGIQANTNFAGATYKNTIWGDGSVKNLELDSSDDSLIVRYQYRLDSDPERKVNLDSGDVIGVTGNAAVDILTGGLMDISNMTEVVFVDGRIRYSFGEHGLGNISVEDGSSLQLTENGAIIVDFGYYTTTQTEFLLIDASEGSVISTKDLMDQITVMHMGKDISGLARIENVDGSIWLYVNVPEPSVYAAIFGSLALAFVAYGRRK